MFNFEGALVVDDSEVMRLTMRTILAPHCERALVAGSYAEAIEVLDEERGLELLLCDVHLPDGDGFQILDYVALRAPLTKVILMTAQWKETDRTRAEQEGATAYLSKPVSIHQIERALQGAVTDRARFERVAGPLRATVLDPSVDGAREVTWRIRNLSMSGAFLEATGPLQLGSVFKLEIACGRHVAMVGAEVVRVQEPGWLHCGGVGVRISVESDEEVADLKAIISLARSRSVDLAS